MADSGFNAAYLPHAYDPQRYPSIPIGESRQSEDSPHSPALACDPLAISAILVFGCHKVSRQKRPIWRRGVALPESRDPHHRIGLYKAIVRGATHEPWGEYITVSWVGPGPAVPVRPVLLVRYITYIYTGPDRTRPSEDQLTGPEAVPIQDHTGPGPDRLVFNNLNIDPRSGWDRTNDSRSNGEKTSRQVCANSVDRVVGW